MRRQFSSNPLGNEILIIPFIIIILMIGFSSFISFFISLCFIVFIIYINVLRAKSIEYDEENLYLINYKKQEKIIPLSNIYKIGWLYTFPIANQLRCKIYYTENGKSKTQMAYIPKEYDTDKIFVNNVRQKNPTLVYTKIG